MSYDPATGVYELSVAKARKWFNDPVQRIAGILADEGLEVLFANHLFLLVRARPDAIWTALGRKPSTREDADDATQPRRYTPMYLASLVKPRLDPRPFNKLLEAAELQYRDGKEWLLTAAGARYGEYVSAIDLERGDAVRTIHWDLAVLDVLGLHWPKPAA